MEKWESKEEQLVSISPSYTKPCASLAEYFSDSWVPKKMSLKSSLVDLFCTPFHPDSPCIPIQQFNMVVNSSCRHRTAYHILCICSALRALHMPGESVDTLKMHHCNRDQLIISYYTYRETNKLFCLQNCNETRNLIKVKTFLVISAIWNLVLRVGIWNEVLTQVVLSRFQTVEEEKWVGHRNI